MRKYILMMSSLRRGLKYLHAAPYVSSSRTINHARMSQLSCLTHPAYRKSATLLPGGTNREVCWNVSPYRKQSFFTRSLSTKPAVPEGQPENLKMQDKHRTRGKKEENAYMHSVLENMVEYQKMLMYRTSVIDVGTNLIADSDPLKGFREGSYKMTLGTCMRTLRELTLLCKRDRDRLLLDPIFLMFCQILADKISSHGRPVHQRGSGGWETITDRELLQIMADLCKFDFREKRKNLISRNPDLKTTHIQAVPEALKDIAGDSMKLITNHEEIRVLLANAFSSACVARMKNWNKTRILYVADFFYGMRYRAYEENSCGYHQAMIDFILKKHLRGMQSTDVVLLLLHLSIARKSHNKIMNALEKRVDVYVNEYSLDELAIVCLGFFKTRTPIRNMRLLESIAEKLAEDAKSADEVSLAGIYKCFGKSTTKTVGRKIPHLVDCHNKTIQTLLPRLSDLNVKTVMHIFSYCYTIQQVSSDFMDAICDVVKAADFSSWRIKDLSKLIFQLGNFQCRVNDYSLYDHCIRELERGSRKEEIAKYPECLVTSLLGLAYVDIFPHSLIDKCLSYSFLKNLKVRGKLDRGRELYQLSETVRIECPDYTGSLLPADYKDQLPQDHDIHGSVPDQRNWDKLGIRDKILLDVQGALSENVKQSVIHFILPHFQTVDIEIRLSKEEGYPLFLHEWSQQSESKDTRIAILVSGPNNYIKYHSPGFKDWNYQLAGLHQMKKRQMTKLGYQVIEVPFQEFNNARNQVDYIHQKVKEKGLRRRPNKWSLK